MRAVARQGPQHLGRRGHDAAGRHDAQVHRRQQAGAAPAGGGRGLHHGAGGGDGGHAAGDTEVGRTGRRSIDSGSVVDAELAQLRADRLGLGLGREHGAAHAVAGHDVGDQLGGHLVAVDLVDRRRRRHAALRDEGAERRRPGRAATSARAGCRRSAAASGGPRFARHGDGEALAEPAEEGGAVARLPAAPAVARAAHTSPAFQRCRNERAAGFGAWRPPPQPRRPGAIAAKRVSGRPEGGRLQRGPVGERPAPRRRPRRPAGLLGPAGVRRRCAGAARAAGPGAGC